MDYYQPRIMYTGKGIQNAPRVEPIYVNDIELFDNIQIQTIEFCNLKCDFCPNHYIIYDRIDDKKKGIPYNKMSVEDYIKIVENLSRLDYCGRFSPYLMNEPLVDKKRIVEFIRIAREYLPDSFIQMDSNGTGLTSDWLGEMIEAGLNRIQLDDYFDDDYAIKMMDASRPHNDNKNFFGLISSNYNVTQAKRGEKNKHTHYGPWTYWNRGGLVNVNPDIPVPQKDCRFPSTQMYIKWNGDALLCCCDWEYQVVHGNVLETSIEDVWINDSYEHYRNTLKKGRRDLLQMCRKCNKDGCKSEGERTIDV
jgi:MoaA/NifB/PqqE/SkfB family radical SAM enzyme